MEPRPLPLPALLPLAAALLAACSAPAPEPAPTPEASPAATIATAPAVDEAPPVRIAEAFLTAPLPGDEIDSVAAWPAPDGRTWLLATAKDGNRLRVFDGDTGELLQTVGETGEGPGQFRRPNGIAVAGDLVFVVERDNRRVQVMRLPGFAPVAMVGQEELLNPYGLWLDQSRPGELGLLVTDSFMADFATETLPPLSELDQRVKRYRLVPEGDGLRVEYQGHFGDTTEAGALRMVESIAGDPANDRLLIAEEDRRVGTTLREYTLAEGRYTGLNLPPERYQAQAEGVALWACPDGSGYWLTVDQDNALSIFHVFGRRDLGYVGSFTGEKVAVTDGIWMQEAGTARFPHGVLYASHDDQAVGAFDWSDIATALGLRRDCDTPR